MTPSTLMVLNLHVVPDHCRDRAERLVQLVATLNVDQLADQIIGRTAHDLAHVRHSGRRVYADRQNDDDAS